MHKRLNLITKNPSDWIQSQSKELFPRVDTSCNKAPCVYEVCIIMVLTVKARCSWHNKKLLKAWRKNAHSIWNYTHLIEMSLGTKKFNWFGWVCCRCWFFIYIFFFFLMGISHHIQTSTFRFVWDCHKDKNPSSCNRMYLRLYCIILRACWHLALSSWHL